jgi:hypothetical protein
MTEPFYTAAKIEPSNSGLVVMRGCPYDSDRIVDEVDAQLTESMDSFLDAMRTPAAA